MKLLQLRVGDYRVLRDLTIDFDLPARFDADIDDPSYAIDFLVGVNGTGKSTVLRALGEIFRRLEGSTRSANFPFEITYQLSDVGTVLVSNIDPETGESLRRFRLKTDEGERLVDELDEQYLPRKIVAYTTGSEAEWQTITTEEPRTDGDTSLVRNTSSTKLAGREVPGLPPSSRVDAAKPSNERSRKFLLVRATQLPILTLCALLMDMAENRRSADRRLRKVLDEANIGKIQGFSLRFRMNQVPKDSPEHDIVDRLSKYAERALHLGSDRLLVFDLTKNEHVLSKRILADFLGGLSLFETLASLSTPLYNERSILQETSLFIERRATRSQSGEIDEVPPIHLLQWLSDGERSFVGRVCLLSIVRATEALILLDEPDVHLNDYWKRQIVRLLDDVLAGEHSHALIATHSGIVLTDVRSEDVVILKRDGNHTGRHTFPGIQTFAGDPSDITVHVFEAPHAAGAQSVARIEQALASPESERKMSELRQLLNQTGPGYWSYRIRRELARMESE